MTSISSAAYSLIENVIGRIALIDNKEDIECLITGVTIRRGYNHDAYIEYHLAYMHNGQSKEERIESWRVTILDRR